ncbi:hypothetical protein QQS21_004609 [Conoideocrella luteorostrata]|uniref:Methyltransferase domain-containing protein n=1 Tax=Conoideocrella luteorostrata TaxID=1105319 RepID=A0AAJ0CR54_9HYPO|nr:hypothetical protein QQS21_004609 [Conoideocrella luteorostrata]
MNSTLASARYKGMLWNCPLSESHSHDLLGHLDMSNARSIVDLGCGWGELLLRAAKASEVKAVGIDTDPTVLERARRASSERHLEVTFVQQSTQDVHDTYDRAICIGSSHALNGSRDMLRRLAELVPRGKVLIGDMCWERPPTKAALAAFSEVPNLMDLILMCRETGWEILHLSVTDQREWDDFESAHRRGFREWLVDNPDHAQAEDVRKQQNSRETDYFTVYRGVLSFAYLVLGR